MLARNETIIKWLLYAGAALLCCLVQGGLQYFTVWGVIPFLYPLAAVIPATYDGPTAGTIFAIGAGILCDLLLPGPIPCIYTLIFPLAALCGGLLSQSLLPAGIFCSLAASAAGFLLLDGFHCVILWANGKAAWEAGGWVMVREFCVTAPFVIPVTLLYRGVYRHTRYDD